MHVPEGTIAAMMTPFDEGGKINEAEARKLVNFLIDKGIDAIFPVSTTGEFTHCDIEERKRLIDIVVDEAKGRTDIIPGIGATCYRKSIELANHVKEKGCVAAVLPGPFFFRNSPDAVEGHLRKVVESVDIPIFLYNIPRFADEVSPQMVEKLCGMPNVVGIKDSSGSMINIMNLLQTTKKIDPDFKVLVGIEHMVLPSLYMGCNGSVTGTAGVLPEFMVAIHKNYKGKNYDLARELQFAILPIVGKMLSVNFPQGFKEALTLRGINMGPSMMSYPDDVLAKISNLKDELESDMNDLLAKYFPGIPLRYV